MQSQRQDLNRSGHPKYSQVPLGAQDLELSFDSCCAAPLGDPEDDLLTKDCITTSESSEGYRLPL